MRKARPLAEAIAAAREIRNHLIVVECIRANGLRPSEVDLACDFFASLKPNYGRPRDDHEPEFIAYIQATMPPEYKAMKRKRLEWIETAAAADEWRIDTVRACKLANGKYPNKTRRAKELHPALFRENDPADQRSVTSTEETL